MSDPKNTIEKKQYSSEEIQAATEEFEEIRNTLLDYVRNNEEFFSPENREASDTVDSLFEGIFRFAEQFDDIVKNGRNELFLDENSEINRVFSAINKIMADPIELGMTEPKAEEEMGEPSAEPEEAADEIDIFNIDAKTDSFWAGMRSLVGKINDAGMSNDKNIQMPMNRIKIAEKKINAFLNKNRNLNELSREQIAPLYSYLKTFKDNINNLSLFRDQLDGGLQQELDGSKKLTDSFLREISGSKGLKAENTMDALCGIPASRKGVDKASELDHFSGMLKQIDDSDPIYIRSSEDFRNAKNDIKDIIKTLKGSKGEVNEKALNAKLTNAYDHTLLYLELKTREIAKNRKAGKEPSELAMKRVETMERIAEALRSKLDESYARNPDLKEPTNKDVVAAFRNKTHKSTNEAEQVMYDAGKKVIDFLESDKINLYEHFNREKAKKLISAIVDKEKTMGKSKEAEAVHKQSAKKEQPVAPQLS